MQPKTAHILLVEDNANYRQEVIIWLTEIFSYENVTTATSAAEATKQLAATVFDVIIADMRMEQDDSGFTILELVRDRSLSSVVIILTANDTVENCRRAFKEGAWDYISKNPKDGHWSSNALETLDQSIQAAIAYLNRWGNRPNQEWLTDNLPSLEERYWGQYVAIVNQSVIEAADSEAELNQRLEERQLRRFTTTIRKIGDLRRIAETIALGEGETVEFKSSLQWDVRLNQQSKKLEINVLKTIAAFLNAQGGTLLIGVEDDGTVFGLEKDYGCLKNGSRDTFELHLSNLVKGKIGQQFLFHLKIRFETVEEKDVCAVHVRASDRLAFLKADEGDKLSVYMRVGNRSEPLTVPGIYDLRV